MSHCKTKETKMFSEDGLTTKGDDVSKAVNTVIHFSLVSSYHVSGMLLNKSCMVLTLTRFTVFLFAV